MSNVLIAGVISIACVVIRAQGQHATEMNMSLKHRHLKIGSSALSVVQVIFNVKKDEEPF